MFEQKDSWTTILVIFVSLITVKLGIQNLKWGLRMGHEFIIQIEKSMNN